MPIDRLRPILVALAALLVALAGVWLIVGAGGDSRRTHVVVDQVPMDEVHPPGAVRHPGVVVAHGFAGSAKLMAQFGDTLAARGYVVVLLDFDGHGANTTPLKMGDDEALQRDLDVAVAHLRSLPDVDPARIALVGHSMGASAVTRYAAGHPDIGATVAISLPDASAARPGHPARLLLLVGGLEFAGFRDAAAQAGGEEVVVPGVEHISILYATRTHRETADFLDNAVGGPLPAPTRRAAGAALLLVALAVGLVPLARLTLGPGTEGWPRFDWPLIGRTTALAAVAATAAALLARFLPTTRLPLALGGYVAALTSITGAALWAYASRRRRHIEAAPTRRARAAPALILYAAITIAVPLQLGLTHVVPVGTRWWLLAVVWAGFALLAYGAERVTGGNSLAALAVSAVTVVVLTAAAIAGLTSSFVLLVAPLLAVLLVWQAAWSAVLHRFQAPRWVIALAGSLLVAWPIATTLPLVG
ncbi:dienelactone hydrolase family protein [Paractinoplanes durhamensis]|uniref:dienelactone hydrolase family protein n=1 Tax=Paractinoplanes durhamensis TaxID=113563 RepID=UPI00194060ED|nr:alpha/beta fold hydrolase [Actinoplanes durhamensis]